MEQLVFVIWTLLKILLIVLPIFAAVAYATYFERRVVGSYKSGTVQTASARLVYCSHWLMFLS